MIASGLVLLTVLAGLSDPPQTTFSPNEKARPGLFRLGPFFLTPRLRIGTIGLDTNVFYTATDRRTDFLASGGPGLDIALPTGRSLLWIAQGGIDYLYFVRTESQRRLTGDGKVGVERTSPRTLLRLTGRYARTFSRPNFEVDERVLQQTREARLTSRLRLGQRFEAEAEGLFGRLETDHGQSFLGADLQRTLTHDTYRAALSLGYRLTPKTSFLIEGDHVHDQFPFERNRDSDSNRAGGGFRLESQTLLSGRVVGGVRSFRMTHGTRPDRLEPYAQGELTYHFGPRTRLGASYDRDLYYSAFEPVAGTPTLRIETARVQLEKGLWGRLDLRLLATGTRLRTDGPVRVTIPGSTGPTTVVRNDRTGQAGADLGYTFRSRLRLGVAAAYTRRRSVVADFGIQGLLVGGTITFIPE